MLGVYVPTGSSFLAGFLTLVDSDPVPAVPLSPTSPVPNLSGSSWICLICVSCCVCVCVCVCDSSGHTHVWVCACDQHSSMMLLHAGIFPYFIVSLLFSSFTPAASYHTWCYFTMATVLGEGSSVCISWGVCVTGVFDPDELVSCVFLTWAPDWAFRVVSWKAKPGFFLSPSPVSLMDSPQQPCCSPPVLPHLF